MKSIRIIVALLMLIICLPSFAGWIDKEGNPVPDTESRKSIGEFGANLLLTDKENETFQRWNTTSVGVNLSTTDKIKRNDFISAFIIFSGCSVNKEGNCNLVVKFRVVQPDGSIYAELPTQEAWVNKPAPGKFLQMSAGYIKIRIEDDEPLGVYQVFADITDQNSGNVISLSSKFEVLE
ncbi:hypothetical protein [Zooshikella sp. RANM57]|uniref:hypothetical protein n=1 Tax=Zooshikella sp. RANM57 TaxID=3425863 RepID=UPI003D6E3139